MVDFNTLKIAEDGKKLDIDVSVSLLKYYDDMYIEAIYIDTEETFIATGQPSEKAINVYPNKEGNRWRSVNMTVLPSHLRMDDFDGHFLYIYVICAGVPAADTPCDMDNYTTMGLALNWYPIYRRGLQFIHSLSNCCGDNKGFIDFILKYRALVLAINTKQFTYINEHFKRWITGGGRTRKSSCGCRR